MTNEERIKRWLARRSEGAAVEAAAPVRPPRFEAMARAEPLSADELLAKVQSRDDRIGAATVYRTMKILTDSGLASARHFDDGQTRYEAAIGRHHHDHLICTSCHQIIEFENERIEELQDMVARQHGFVVTRHKLELYGLCKDCQGRR